MKTLLSFAAALFIVGLLPTAADAAVEIELSDVDPIAYAGDLVDITDQIDTSGKPEEDMNLFIYSTSSINEGTEITLTYEMTGTEGTDVSSGPLVVMMAGAYFQEPNVGYIFEYDEETEVGTVTMPIVISTLYDNEGSLQEALGISFMTTVYEVGQGGPTEEARGTYLATNTLQHEMIPAMPDNPTFGFSITGPQGSTGFLHFKITEATVDVIGAPVEDLAVFDGDSQASLGIEATDDGGALVAINYDLRTSSTKTGASIVSAVGSAPKMVTKSFTAGEKLTLSIAAKKSRIVRKKYTKIYGWHKSGQKGKTIQLYKKNKGKKKYKKVKQTKTKKNGYYKFSLKLKKVGSYAYKVKYVDQAKDTTTWSTKQKIKVLSN